MFPYFAPYMDVTVSSERHLPTVSGGYSNTNCHEYSNNRTHMVEKYQPFLLKSLENLEMLIKRRIDQLITKSIKMMHENGDREEDPNIYNSSEGNQERSDMNKKNEVGLLVDWSINEYG